MNCRCTADVTFLMVHDPAPRRQVVKFEYLMLPACVTDRFKVSESIEAEMGESGNRRVADFVGDPRKPFLVSCIKARKA